MDVLSVFDGMSCGQIALKRAGINVANYYASEIDKYAIKVTWDNFPDTIQIGDVLNVKSDNLPKIDLIIGGSPCQGFSFAGKQLNFDDPRSKLFFEFVRLLKELRAKNPDILFLLENVKMKKEYQNVISEYLGVQPIEINSALVSSQNRKRLYWTNIEGIEQPDDKGLIVKDILIDNFNYSNGAIRGRSINDSGLREDYSKIPTEQHFERRLDGKTNTLTTDNYLLDLDKLSLSEKAKSYMSRLRNGRQRWEYHTNNINEKASTLTANMYKGIPYGVIKDYSRKLHPVECERLQTVPDNYTSSVSNSQRYKMLGNGWTVDVIAHILSYVK